MTARAMVERRFESGRQHHTTERSLPGRRQLHIGATLSGVRYGAAARRSTWAKSCSTEGGMVEWLKTQAC